MIVVADTSPLNYLIQLKEVDLLHDLYKRVAIPVAVHVELPRRAAPVAVRQWAAALPNWIEVMSVQPAADSSLQHLDAGEREAILLAEYTGAELVIIDEATARSVAERRGLRVTGTLGVLKEASRLGLIDLEETVQHLRKTNFRISERVLEGVLTDLK